MTLPDPEMFAGTPRFAVQRRLGAGSFGVVYEVLDRVRGSPLALKVLRSGTGKALYRFKQEFRALTDISHPNLIALYELLSDGGRWFFTMERIEGITFVDYVRGAEAAADLSMSTGEIELEGGTPSPSTAPAEAGAPLTEDGRMARLRVALRQLGAGVAALHAHGMLHRDLKPSNVLVTPEGRVVILDFGLVREMASSGVTATEGVLGTPAYMSPEQAAGRAVTPASDWYAVGAILYESLTGRLPFVGDPLDVVRRKQVEDPPAPDAIAPGVPPELSSLCADLLRRDPALRPRAPDVLRAIEAAPAPGTAAMPEAGFVGRRHELDRLDEALAVVKAGRGVTVTVQGASGIGKTALVRRFLEGVRAREPSAVVLSGRCYEREWVPYKALDSVIDALIRHLRALPERDAETFLPHDVLALARLFPVLRLLPGVIRARRTVLDIPDSQELRRRAFSALRELFVRLADRHTVVVSVDDLQWGDADSVSLLAELMKPPDSPALLFIGCFRSDETATSPLLSALLPLRDAPSAAGLLKVDISLSELSPDETRRLASDLLGTAGAGAVDAIVRESQGSPFLVDALTRYASHEPSAVLLEDVIRRRVAALSDSARRLLEVVVTAGRPLEVGAARDAAGLDSDEEAAIATLRSAHFIRTRRRTAWDELEPYHDRVGLAVRAGMSTDALRTIHERLAVSLLAAGRADPETLVEHFTAAGRAEDAAEHALSAARVAEEALAFDRAATMYRLSLSRDPGRESEARAIRLRLADALANAGRGREASEAYRDCLPGADLAQDIDLQRKAAQQLLLAGHVDEGLERLAAVLASVHLSMPRGPRMALAGVLVRRALLRVRGTGFRRRPESRVPAWDLLRIDVCASVAVGLAMIDMVRAGDFQARSLLLALRAGEPTRVARGLALHATFLATGGTRTVARAERLLRAAQSLSDEVHDVQAAGLVAVGAGITAWIQGRWSDARRLCDEATAILRENCTGTTWESDNADMYALASLFLLGDIKEMSRRLPDLLLRAQERGNLLNDAFLRVGFFSHMVALAADDPGTARRHLAEGLSRAPSSLFDFRRIWGRGARRDIALYTGEGLEEEEPLLSVWRPAARLLDRFAQAGAILGLDSRARRRLALAARGPDRAAHLARVGLHARAIERERTPWGMPSRSCCGPGRRPRRPSRRRRACSSSARKWTWPRRTCRSTP